MPCYERDNRRWQATLSFRGERSESPESIFDNLISLAPGWIPDRPAAFRNDTGPLSFRGEHSESPESIFDNLISLAPGWIAGRPESHPG